MSNLDQIQQNEQTSTQAAFDKEEINSLMSNAINVVCDAIKKENGIEITGKGITIQKPLADFKKFYGIGIEVASTVNGVDKLYAQFDKPENYIRYVIESAIDKLQNDGVGVLSTSKMNGLILLPTKTNFLPEHISKLNKIRYYPNSNMRSITYIPYIIVRENNDIIEKIPFTYGDLDVISFLDFNYAQNVGNVFLEYYQEKNAERLTNCDLSVGILSIDINKCFEEDMCSVTIIPDVLVALVNIGTLNLNKFNTLNTLEPRLIGEYMCPGENLFPIGEITVEKDFECMGNKFSLIKQHEIRPNETIYYVRIEDGNIVHTLLTENQESLEVTLSEISNYIHDNISPNKESVKPFVVPGVYKEGDVTDKGNAYLCFIQHHVNDQTKFKSELPSDVIYSALIDKSLNTMFQFNDVIQSNGKGHCTYFVPLSNIIDFISKIDFVRDDVKKIFSGYLFGDKIIEKMFDFTKSENGMNGSESESLKLNKVNLCLYLTEMFNKGLFGQDHFYIPVPTSPSKLLNEEETEEYPNNEVSDILFTSTENYSDCELGLYVNDVEFFFHCKSLDAVTINKISADMLLGNCEEIKESNIISNNSTNTNLMATTLNKITDGTKMLSNCRLFKMPDGSRVMGFMTLINEEELNDFSKNELKFGLDNWYLMESTINYDSLDVDDGDTIYVDNKFTGLKFSEPDSSNLTMFSTHRQNQKITSINDLSEDAVLFVAEDGRHYIGLYRIQKPIITK